MKKCKKKIAKILLILCITLVGIADISSGENTVNAASKVKISKQKVTLLKGKSVKLKVKGTKKKVKWSSNNKKVATVTSKGKVTAKKEGTAKITAKVGKKKYTCKVTVKIPNNQKHSFDYVTTVAPTCTEKGYDLYKCSCGATKKDNYTEALGHETTIDDLVQYTITEEPTEKEEGTAEELCFRCHKCVGTKKITMQDLYTYEFQDNGVVINSFEKNYGGAIHVPSKIKGKRVISIEVFAFDGCSRLTSIEIPDSVTSIGNGAFSECSSLTSIKIPDSVTSIGFFLFSGCSGLTSIELPENITSIGVAFFDGCSSLTSIEIPSSVTNICDMAFNGCSSLTSVTIPDSVTSIGESAFENCSSLMSITIPDSVVSIGDFAFWNCSDDFVLYGSAGSYAEEYAKNNEIPFQEL